jgi:type IV pilus assembly protein PilE
MNKRPAAGFTLIELVITMIVLAVLLAIAIPSYEEFVQRSRRADGRELLSSLAQAQGRYYANNARYATTLTELGISDATSEHDHYTATLAVNGRGYRITAAPHGVQANDPCGALTLDDLGIRGVANGSLDAQTCWR